MTQPPVDVDDDLPTVVSPEYVAARFGLGETAATLRMIRYALLDAQADVVAYLRRPITPQTYTVSGVAAYGPTWRFDPVDVPVHTIDTVTAETDAEGNPTGFYTLVYTAGLDAANDPALAPIRRYVVAHAANSPQFVSEWSRTESGKAGTIKSASTEGQSVTYDKATLGGGGEAGSGKPGALPSISSLDQWGAGPAVFQRRGFDLPWPYGRAL